MVVGIVVVTTPLAGAGEPISPEPEECPEILGEIVIDEFESLIPDPRAHRRPRDIVEERARNLAGGWLPHERPVPRRPN